MYEVEYKNVDGYHELVFKKSRRKRKVELFDEVDVDLTCKNVVAFLKKYSFYKTMAVSYPTSEFDTVVKEIDRAINNMDADSRVILHNLYINDQKRNNNETMFFMSIGREKYYSCKKSALMLFAACYNSGQLLIEQKTN